MNRDRIEAEREAVQSLMTLYEQAKKCEQLYDLAHMTLPEPLTRFLGVNGNGDRQGSSLRMTAHIPAPDWPKPPDGAGQDWISINVKEAIATTVVLAVLRGAAEPVRASEVVEHVLTLLPNVTRGGVANVGTRLVGDKTIERTEDGWMLLKVEKAGLVRDGRLWAPPGVFAKPEMAAHRREAILHVLKHFPTGLQTVQIVEQLRNCSWLHAPVNKDLLKLDMESLLEAKKVRRRGNTKKWELAPG